MRLALPALALVGCLTTAACSVSEVETVPRPQSDSVQLEEPSTPPPPPEQPRKPPTVATPEPSKGDDTFAEVVYVLMRDRDFDLWFCTGTLVAKDRVVTAAHCLDKMFVSYEIIAPLSRITAKSVRRADMRAYAYRAGHYLLPHSDHQQGVGRALAYAYYFPSPEPPEGGELELFRCTVDEDGEIVATESACLVEPRPNRLVVFDVSDVSLHQVREVLAGLRPSLSGWFYP